MNNTVVFWLYIHGGTGKFRVFEAEKHQIYIIINKGIFIQYTL
jgi:hypothetical protein